MESGELPLDKLVVIYEEGLRLVGFCSERLEDAEKRLQTITRDSTGKPKGLGTIQTPSEIPPSTAPDASGKQEDSGGAGGSAARLY